MVSLFEILHKCAPLLASTKKFLNGLFLEVLREFSIVFQELSGNQKQTKRELSFFKCNYCFPKFQDNLVGMLVNVAWHCALGHLAAKPLCSNSHEENLILDHSFQNKDGLKRGTAASKRYIHPFHLLVR